jgi:hypothetical protein
MLELAITIALTLLCTMAGLVAMWLTTYQTSTEWPPWVAFVAVTVLLIFGLNDSSLMHR